MTDNGRERAERNAAEKIRSGSRRGVTLVKSWRAVTVFGRKAS